MSVEDLSSLIVQIFSISDVYVGLWNYSTGFPIPFAQRQVTIAYKQVPKGENKIKSSIIRSL